MNSRYTNITLDNTSPSFTYSISDWAILGPNGTIGTAANVSAVESYQDRGNFYNGSLGVSTVVGGRVDLSFNGEFISWGLFLSFVVGAKERDGAEWQRRLCTFMGCLGL